MSDEQTLIPIEQKQVVFYEDEITAVLVDSEGGQQIYVPIRPICEMLGIDWPSQSRRIKRDAVLSKYLAGVVVTTPPDPVTGGGGPQTANCLPLEYLNGWLFSVNASRVKDEIREKLIRYQEECYRILAAAFTKQPVPSPGMTALEQVEQIGLAIAQMAREQMEFDRRLTTTEDRLDKAAVVVGDINKRLQSLEERVAPGEPVTNEQAAQISDTVKAIAIVLGKQSGRNEFAGVYTELYRRFGITSYKLLPATKFGDCMRWLGNWYEELTGETPF